VVRAEDQQLGLVVDGVHDTEEIVVKPLGSQLKGVAAFAGATIMGDGRVALILDVLGLAQRAGVLSDAARERVAAANDDVTEISVQEKTSLLVLALSDGVRVAIPLAEVSRLEEFPAQDVELGNGVEVVQYRDDILPLIRLEDALGHPRGPEPAILQVVVHQPAEGPAVGLVAGAIVDIVEEVIEPKALGRRAGVIGACVVHGRVTDLLDLPTIIDRALGVGV